MEPQPAEKPEEEKQEISAAESQPTTGEAPVEEEEENKRPEGFDIFYKRFFIYDDK